MQKNRAASKKIVAVVAVQELAAPTAATVATIVSEKKKRGRKKTIETPTQPTQPTPTQPTPTQPTQPTPTQPTQPNAQVTTVAPKKKRVNKKHATTEPQEPQPESHPNSHTLQIQEPAPQPGSSGVVVAAHKKRGRKPKGGKVIQQLVHEAVSMHDAPNIILHLKCSVSDIPDLNATLTETSIKPGDVISFNSLETKGADLNDSYQSTSTVSRNNFIISSGSSAANSRKSKPTPDALIATNSYNHLNDDADCDDDCDANDDEPGSNDTNLKDIWKKLNHLKLCFHKSDVFQNIGAGTRRSCCFWDTCEFDTPPVYIPKCIAPNGGYNVYGCFCGPECALAYLMNEGVDTSVKFERCQMLNSMYGKLLNYEKSIKPAPNPQYILNKFYGNLSIQEYRKLFKSEQIVYVVNKPLTHILPEMYEDNNDFLLNNKVIPNNNYKLKKKTSVFG
jgi:hypothetical protein